MFYYKISYNFPLSSGQARQPGLLWWLGFIQDSQRDFQPFWIRRYYNAIDWNVMDDTYLYFFTLYLR